MPWWVWIIFGLALLGAELMVGTFYLFFLGLAALVVGLIVVFGLVPGDGLLWLESLLFLVFSTILVLALRRPMMGKFKLHDDKRDLDSITGEAIVVGELIAPGAIGRVEMRGTQWSAKNVGSVPLAVGQRCRIERTEGLTLWVRGESA